MPLNIKNRAIGVFDSGLGGPPKSDDFGEPRLLMVLNQKIICLSIIVQ